MDYGGLLWAIPESIGKKGRRNEKRYYYVKRNC